MAAQRNGAEVENYCRVEKAVRKDGLWQVTILNEQTNVRFERTARALVNAAGPWVKQFFDDSMEEESPRNIRLVKGSHIVVPRIHDEEQAYILQNKDNRIVLLFLTWKTFLLSVRQMLNMLATHVKSRSLMTRLIT